MSKLVDHQPVRYMTRVKVKLPKLVAKCEHVYSVGDKPGAGRLLQTGVTGLPVSCSAVQLYSRGGLNTEIFRQSRGA